MERVVVGSVSKVGWDYAAAWVLSLRACGYTGEVVLVTVDCKPDLYDNARRYGARTIEFPESDLLTHFGPNPLNGRFNPLSRVLLDSYPDHFALVADVRDVYFQADPFAYFDQGFSGQDLNRLFITPEEVLHDHDSRPGQWNADKMEELFSKTIREEAAGTPIYNIGVVCGPGALLAGLFRTVYLICFNSEHRGGDQAAFNLVLQTQAYKSISTVVSFDEGWAVNWAPVRNKAVPPEKEAFWDGELIKSREGKTFAIVHQYNRNRPIVEMVQSKLGDWERAIEEQSAG